MMKSLDKRTSMTRIIIVGAGFAGLEAAKQLKGVDCDLLIIDRVNHHLFQPLLYQVATAALSPGDIAEPIREILHEQKNCRVLMATVDKVDTERNVIILNDGTEHAFDYLILAPGSRHSYWGKDEWEPLAPGLKTIQDAINIRETILSSFERAERAESPKSIQSYLNFVIVGGGPTGVEMAGAIAEIAFKTLIHDFRKINTSEAKVYLIEGASQILPGFPESLALKAETALKKLGVEVLKSTIVTKIDGEGVLAGPLFIPSHCVIWAAGNQASPLLKTLGVPLDKNGRVIVEKDLSIPDHSNIFVLGDAACFINGNGKALPGLAPVAKQQGAFIAKLIKEELAKNARSTQSTRPVFTYCDKGSIATIGRGKAVGIVGGRSLSGLIAWLIWSLIHIFYLIGFENRLIVITKWIFLFFTGRRNVQIISRPLESQSKGISDRIQDISR